MGDHVRHQTHNSNEMIRRFLNDIAPAAVEPRMYQTSSWGYGDRLPYDHHEEISLIAPRAVLIDATNNDYADNAEGDAIGFEAAKPVYEFLGASQNLALDLDMGMTGHGLTTAQAEHIVDYANYVLYGTALTTDVETQLTTDPYLNAGTYNTYYGGLSTMMPWASTVPHANLLTSLSVSVGALSPAFSELTNVYTLTVPYGTASTKVTAASEDPKATIAIGGQTASAGTATATAALAPGANTIPVVVTAVDSVTNTYQAIVTETGATTTSSVASSTTNANLGAALTFTATVKATQGSAPPLGTVEFLDGTTVLGTADLTVGSSTASTATFAISTLSAGTHSITAAFLGTPAFLASTSLAYSQLVTAPALTTTISPNTINISKGGSAQTTVTLTPVGGYSGTVALACGSAPSGVTVSCSFSPASITLTGSNVVQTSTLSVSMSGSAALARPGTPGSPASRVAWALVILPLGLLTLARRRREGLHKLLLVTILAVTSLGGMLWISGCGGSSSSATSSGSYVLPINVSANGTTTTVNVVVVMD